MKTLAAVLAMGLIVAAITRAHADVKTGAVHGFTNPESGNDNSKGAAYNERADRRSWEAMKAFFAETLK